MDVPGPRHWHVTYVLAIERALMTKQEPDGEAILVPRPEIEGLIHNPYTIQTWAQDSSISFTLLPRAVQGTILAYVRYRYQEQHCTPPTLQGDLDAIMQFFCWLCQQHAPQSDYCSWDRETLRTLVQTYLTTACAHLKVTSRYSRISKLYVFFQTLAEMGLPYPPGYTALLALRPAYPHGVRPIPREEVLDRIFREGVCHLDYDPFSRLALTIQYFCGSRITETCDLHLFCVLEDHEGHAFLLIPLGKTKQERVFPIVDVGMGPLLQFMDEVVGMQLRPDGTVRALSRANYRYLSTQPERAANWLYLFDRFRTDTYRNRGRLSYTRASDALREALILTAKVNPSGLFQEQTYSPECHMRRPRGQYCVYFASRDGITVCPMCHGPLPGQRGTRCTRRLPEDFVCEGVARSGEYFCPKCDRPLARLIDVTTHTFRHNSVTRAHRSGVPMAQNMLLHGHQTIPMHLRYLHLGQEDAHTAVRQVMTEKHIQQLHLATPFIPGQIIEDGVATTVSLEQLLGLTLRRGLKRRTAGLWGGFWAGTLAEQGTLSPVRNGQELVLTEETYYHAVAQYRYEALGLAVSEVALEQGTGRTFQASVASFLDREKIEQLVACYLNALLHQGYLSTARGVRLVEAEIQAQRGFLNELAEMLRPWWQYLGSIERLVSELLPNVDRFQKEEGEHAH
jgi:integrase